MARPVGVHQVFLEYPFEDNQDQSKSVLTITQHDFKRLKSPNFLNDSIISFFMQYHLDTSVSPEVREQIHVFNSFFFSKIKPLRRNPEDEVALKRASRWLKGVDIFSKDFLIMPVCEQDHWVLVIICYPANIPNSKNRSARNDDIYEPAVLVLNSLPGYAPSVKKSLNHFLRYQWRVERKSIRRFPINEAKKNGIRLIFPHLPNQRNNYNCGVYILNYFYCFLKDPRGAYLRMFRKRDLEIWFEENNINIQLERKRMENLLKELRKTYLSEQSSKNLTKESQEIVIGSPSRRASSTPISVDGGESDAVIVIN